MKHLKNEGELTQCKEIDSTHLYQVNKKKKNKLSFLIVPLCLILALGQIYVHVSRIPSIIDKTYSGVCINHDNKNFIKKSKVKITGKYYKWKTIYDFKLVDEFQGTISIDDNEYPLSGVSLTTENENYIGLTAHESADASYFIYAFDNLESMVLYRIARNDISTDIIVPADNMEDAQKIIARKEGK